jgi:hypothetical protein
MATPRPDRRAVSESWLLTVDHQGGHAWQLIESGFAVSDEDTRIDDQSVHGSLSVGSPSNLC